MTKHWRAIVWGAFLVAAALRPGVDAIDRRLVRPAWNIPSNWNAIADAAMRSGVVDSRIDGQRAPWRQASVISIGGHRVGVITVSDLRRSRITFITDRYEPLGSFERLVTDPGLVTDEARGFKPLSHIWPVVEDPPRLLTLVAMAPLRSDPVNMGVFAYLGVGATDTELLFVCRLTWGPDSMHVELVREDVNGDGRGDLVLYPRERRDAAPAARFVWQPQTREYVATVSADARPLVAWWSTSPGNRIIVGSSEPVDTAISAVAARLNRH